MASAARHTTALQDLHKLTTSVLERDLCYWRSIAAYTQLGSAFPCLKRTSQWHEPSRLQLPCRSDPSTLPCQSLGRRETASHQKARGRTHLKVDFNAHLAGRPCDLAFLGFGLLARRIPLAPGRCTTRPDLNDHVTVSSD